MCGGEIGEEGEGGERGEGEGGAMVGALDSVSPFSHSTILLTKLLQFHCEILRHA